MRSITGQLTDQLARHVGTAGVAKASAFPVRTYRELMEHVAQLAYLNKDDLLFFRGQGQDYRNKAGASTIYPAIYRGERLSQEQIELRFDILMSAAKRLCNALSAHNVTGQNDVRRRRYIQWGILQHYEVCPTPLLDLTHSLRAACSFAFLASDLGEPCVFVFGLPYITNRVSVNSEHDMAIVRLLSICPPDALRPYFQDGYLAGTDEVLTEYDSKDELDFNRRLIAKFTLSKSPSFWGRGFSPLPKNALYPSKDRFERICAGVRKELGTDVEPGRLGQFLQDWTDLENVLLSAARQRHERVFSLREALSILAREEKVPSGVIEELNAIRRLRNQAVHEPRGLQAHELTSGRERLASLRRKLKELGL